MGDLGKVLLVIGVPMLAVGLFYRLMLLAYPEETKRRAEGKLGDGVRDLGIVEGRGLTRDQRVDVNDLAKARVLIRVTRYSIPIGASLTVLGLIAVWFD